MPTATPPDTYQIGLRCAGANLGVQTALRVLRPARHSPSSSPAQQPPADAQPSGQGGGAGANDDNGSTSWSEVAWMVGALAAGAAVGALGFAAWRRRRT